MCVTAFYGDIIQTDKIMNKYDKIYDSEEIRRKCEKRDLLS